MFRHVVQSYSLSNLISETRFLDCYYIKSSLILLDRDPVGEESIVQTEIDAIDKNINHHLADLESLIQSRIVISMASASWLEMLIVEITLRNRDRFNLLWPSLERHYSFLSGCDEFSYAVER